MISDNTEVKDIHDAVTLMTIHAVKGLEFDYVFLVGMEENIFPHANSMFSQEELEEERRLCYVAITRCKKKLYMTNARIRLLYGKDQVNPVSRFISEIVYNSNKEEKVKLSDTYEEKEMDYEVGDFVYHENFGAGKVVEIIPNKKDPQRTLLKIAFKLPYGIKTLIYSHKSLRKV